MCAQKVNCIEIVYALENTVLDSYLGVLVDLLPSELYENCYEIHLVFHPIGFLPGSVHT